MGRSGINVRWCVLVCVCVCVCVSVCVHIPLAFLILLSRGSSSISGGGGVGVTGGVTEGVEMGVGSSAIYKDMPPDTINNCQKRKSRRVPLLYHLVL